MNNKNLRVLGVFFIILFTAITFFYDYKIITKIITNKKELNLIRKKVNENNKLNEDIRELEKNIYKTKLYIENLKNKDEINLTETLHNISLNSVKNNVLLINVEPKIEIDEAGNRIKYGRFYKANVKMLGIGDYKGIGEFLKDMTNNSYNCKISGIKLFKEFEDINRSFKLKFYLNLEIFFVER